MPRITKEDKAKNRQNIIEAAGRMFRAQGIDAVGIAELMKEAGLTHGGFYNHFASRTNWPPRCAAPRSQRLWAPWSRPLRKGRSRRPTAEASGGRLSLRRPPRRPGRRLPSASLVIDAGRHNDTVQHSYAVGVEGYLAGFAAEIAREYDEETAPQQARDRAVLLLSRLVGAMVLARAVRHVQPELSDEILRTCRTHALD
ncbi:TetR family transcriptional regulator [Streptomyces sp. M19]